MMKSILLSIKPKYVELIASGEKTIEVRKTRPKIETPFKCFIYETQGQTETPWIDEDGHFIYKGRGQVIGEFICDKVDKIIPLQQTYYNYIGLPIARITEYGIWNDDLPQMCLTKKEINDYGNGKTLYGWHISDLKIYDKPRNLSEFSRPCSYSGFCFSCKRTSFKKDGNLLCNTKITRPPQSWMHVEDLGEEK